jgi:hypothetical protein
MFPEKATPRVLLKVLHPPNNIILESFAEVAKCILQAQLYGLCKSYLILLACRHSRRITCAIIRVRNEHVCIVYKKGDA